MIKIWNEIHGYEKKIRLICLAKGIELSEGIYYFKKNKTHTHIYVKE